MKHCLILHKTQGLDCYYIMIAKMNCHPLSTARQHKEQIHKAESVHSSVMIGNQNNQLLVEVQALMFKRNFQCTYMYQTS